jgi:hypothetical protein
VTEQHTGVHQFTLLDARGREHSYVVTEHPAGEGMEVMFALLSMGVPTALGLAGAALQTEKLLNALVAAFTTGAEASASEDDWKDLASMAVGLDLPAVGRELGVALASGRAPELTRKILSRTHRDGHPLSNTFDLAYQANYLEMIQAIWKVCWANRFFPVPSTLLNASSGATRAAPTLPPVG